MTATLLTTLFAPENLWLMLRDEPEVRAEWEGDTQHEGPFFRFTGPRDALERLVTDWWEDGSGEPPAILAEIEDVVTFTDQPLPAAPGMPDGAGFLSPEIIPAEYDIPDRP